MTRGESWADVPMVFIPLPACPLCGAYRPIIVRSEAGGDGSTTRKAICRRCSRRFKIVVEPPKPDCQILAMGELSEV